MQHIDIWDLQKDSSLAWRNKRNVNLKFLDIGDIGITNKVKESELDYI